MTTRPTELVADELAQNIAVAPRLVMGGGVHADAAATVARGRLSGDQKHHSTASGLELEEAR